MFDLAILKRMNRETARKQLAEWKASVEKIQSEVGLNEVERENLRQGKRHFRAMKAGKGDDE